MLLLACGLAACGPSSDGATSGAHEAEVDDAISACSAFATKLDQCYGDTSSGSAGYGYANYLSALGYCITYLGYAEQSGPACKNAIEEMYACISKLDCDQLIVTEGGDGGSTSASEPDPCAAEQMAADAACGWDDGDLPGTTTSG